MLEEEGLQLGALVKLQEATEAPHEGEDEEALQVGLGHVGFLLTGRHKALEEIAGLRTQAFAHTDMEDIRGPLH